MAKSQGQICPSMWSAMLVPEKAACPRADLTPSPENNMQFFPSCCGSHGQLQRIRGHSPALGQPKLGDSSICPLSAPWLYWLLKTNAGGTVFYTTKKCNFKTGTSQPNLTAHCYSVSAPLCSQQCP